MNQDRLEQLYWQAVNTPSDINEHLQTLRTLAEQCTHVTEFGTRWGTSIRAFVTTNAIVRAYDIELYAEALAVVNLAMAAGKDVQLIKGSTLDIIDLPETDMILIDTLHTYDQVKAELQLHGNRSRKYLCFHDTELFADIAEDHVSKGIWPAIEEFMTENPHWKLLERRRNNNGMTVLARI
jgi:cephalosporin hydroxylase